MTRSRQASICFAIAGILFLVIAVAYPPSSTPREQWGIALALIWSFLGMLGAGVGASLGNLWVGLAAGFILPIVALMLLGGFGLFC